jgi:hypothetical protein
VNRRILMLAAFLFCLVPGDALARVGGGSHSFRSPSGGGGGGRGIGGGHGFFFFGGGGGGFLLLIFIVIVMLYLISRSRGTRQP